MALAICAVALNSKNGASGESTRRWITSPSRTTLAPPEGAMKDENRSLQQDCEALPELRAEIARLKEVADLAGGVAHNFNNLLQIVMGGIELALLDLGRGNPAPLTATLERTLRSVRHGAETARRLQKFARVREEETEHDVSICDLSDIAAQAVEMSEPWWKTDPERKGIKVNLTHELSEGCLVQGREGELF